MRPSSTTSLKMNSGSSMRRKVMPCGVKAWFMRSSCASSWGWVTRPSRPLARATWKYVRTTIGSWAALREKLAEPGGERRASCAAICAVMLRNSAEGLVPHSQPPMRGAAWLSDAISARPRVAMRCGDNIAAIARKRAVPAVDGMCSLWLPRGFEKGKHSRASAQDS